MIKKYIKLWWIMSLNSSQIAFSSRSGALIFILGKILRFAFFLFFLIFLVGNTRNLGGYSLWEVIFFYATFNIVDVISQLFLREVYRFRSYVVSGEFDYFLTKPISPLFRSLFGGSDVLDLIILVISTALIVIGAQHLGNIHIFGVILYVILIVNALTIALAFHIFILALGVLTTEVDNTLWLYRDLTQTGRVPVDIYQEPLRGLLTFVIPVAIMMTFPARALMGTLDWPLVIVSIIVSSLFMYLSLKAWDFSLKFYSSASS